MKKILSLFLCLTILLVSSVTSLAVSDVANTDDNTITPMSNRYYYTTEKGPKIRQSTKYYTESQARNQDSAVAVVSAALAFAAPAGPIVSFTYIVGNAIYDTRVAGRIETYKTVETRYRVDRLTGKKTKTATYWAVEIKVYAGSSLHRTFNHRLRLK